ncbi:MAG: UDP-3-O-(3-hydroxymyristoyl)glucosamine N-acyltransferase [candidate division WOR-3 bacterium]
MKLIEVARIVNGVLYGRKDFLIKNILPPEEAGPDDLAFLFDSSIKTRAGAVIARKEIRGKSGIVVRDPRRAMYQLLKRFTGKIKKREISPLSWIDKQINLPKFCVIEPYVTIKRGVKIGSGTFIGAGAYVDEGVIIGKNCTIGQGVVIYKNTKLGNFVEIGAHTVIGKEGFGYINKGSYKRIRHIGGVDIADYVEIGSNVAIDRGTIGDTTIGKGTKIDNLVHIAHNVKIGKNCLIMGQTGIAGSTKIGNNVILCGQVGVSDHLKIGDNTVVYAKSGVFKDLIANEQYSGIPARRHKLVLRALARLYHQIEE